MDCIFLAPSWAKRDEGAIFDYDIPVL